jgi:hypothetical protein
VILVNADSTAQESCIIMVIIKVSKVLKVFSTNITAPTGIKVFNSSHILPIGEKITENKELWVIQNPVNFSMNYTKLDTLHRKQQNPLHDQSTHQLSKLLQPM